MAERTRIELVRLLHRLVSNQVPVPVGEPLQKMAESTGFEPAWLLRRWFSRPVPNRLGVLSVISNDWNLFHSPLDSLSFIEIE